MKKTFLTGLLFCSAMACFGQYQISRGEYYIDTDPGVGNGIPILVAAYADSVTDTISITTSALSFGYHRVYMRYANDSGLWGMSANELFYINNPSVTGTGASAPPMVKGEYFVDTDPGAGNGTAFTASGPDSTTDSVNIPTTSLAVGYHRLYIRYQDSLGRWGITTNQLFNIIDTGLSTGSSPILSIVKGEYFVDTDPGPGNGTAFTAEGVDSTTDSISISTDSISPGYHRLYLRYKDSAGTWGITTGQLFNIINPALSTSAPPIKKGEYFVDTDPGVGNGVGFTASGADSTTDSLSIATTSLSIGYHRAYIRYEDSVGRWSIPISELFDVIDTTITGAGASSPSIIAGEYFVDTDPGVGNGTAFSSSGPDSSTNSITIATGSLSAGGHAVFTRYRDSLGKWGITAANVFFVCATPPGPITGAGSTCPAGTIALSDTTAGSSHSWSSSNTSVATAGSTGIVTGVAAGTATISYTVTITCGTVFVITTVTVNPLLIAGSITGASSVCVSANITLSDAATGGTWQSGNPGVAIVNSSGVVTGEAAGTATISYSVSNSCGTSVATYNVTASPLPTDPESISGASAICVATSSAFSDGTTGGTWSSSNTAIATVGSAGSVSGIATGEVTISYTLTNSCGSSSAVATIAIDSTPVVPALTGTTTLCASATTTLSDVAGGGSWSSSNAGAATVNSSGMVTGVAAGSAIITYEVTNICTSTLATTVVTVNPLPVTPASITGTLTVCTLATTTLSDIASGGTWSSSNDAIATIGSSGTVSGVSAGSVTISYTISNTCGGNSVTASVAVVPSSPVVITGTNAVCLGATITLSDATTGGSWSSSNMMIATVGSAGVVLGAGGGDAVISYSISNYCGTSFAIYAVTVNTVPASAGSITGPGSVCPGATITLSDGISGGSWSASNGNATISSGELYGVIAGTADTITYIISNSCGADSTTTAISITALPVAGIITGPSSMCLSSPTSLADTVAGGVWASLDPAVATADAGSGLITGIYPGLAVIEYSVYNGCSTAVTATEVVIGPYVGAITGPGSVIAGATVTMSDAITGGTWSVGNSSVATISAGGVVTGVALGTTVISYTITSDCGTVSATMAFSVGYCIPAHDSAAASITDGRIIARFVFAGLLDTLIDFSSPNGTNNYEDLSATLTAYAAVNSTVVCGMQDSMPYPNTGSAQVYIDFNNDQIFESSESVGGLNPVNNVLAAFPVTIPPYSDTGLHRMRVIFSYGDGAFGGGVYPDLNPCAVSLYGDVRDYTVDIENYPFFPGGSPRTTRACVASATPIDSLLTVYNAAAGQTEQWTILAYPFHGTLSGFPKTMTSTGGTVTPTGLSYTGAFAYSGDDQFSVRVYDGSRYVDAIVNVIDGLPSITGAFVIDTGTAIVLSDLTMGGTWSSSNTAVATIDSISGLATAQLINGVAIITYSITDSVCGIISTSTELPVVAQLCYPTFIDAPQSKDDGVSLEGFFINGELGTSISDAVPSNGTDNFEDLNATYSVVLNKHTNYQVSYPGNSSESIQVWIDYNDDGVFQTSEIVGGGTWPYTGDADSIFIGDHVPTGAHLMRIVANAPAYPIHDTSGRYYPDITTCSFDNVYYGDGRDYTVIIDSLNHPPHFARQYRIPSLYNICVNNGPVDLDSLLAITDEDSGQTETWSVIDTGSGIFGGFDETSLSNGDLLFPGGKTYMPDTGFRGYDQFIVQVSDGFATDVITIGVHVGLPDSGTIYAENGCGAASNEVYLGYSCLALEDYVPYHLRQFDQSYYFGPGVWSSSNPNIASIDSMSGQVTGVSLGTATMTYTVVDSCGPNFTTYPVVVIPPPVITPCSDCVPPPPPPAPGIGCSTPYFVNGLYQNLNVCENTTNPINSLLTINDPNTGTLTEVWSAGSPTHGSLGGLNDTMITAGGIATPAGITYTPDSGYTGPDAFTVYISDGQCGSGWTYIRVLVGPYAGVITGDSIFAIGSTDTLLYDDQPDGIWTSSDYDVAGVSIFSIGGNGVLSFVSPGDAVIAYTVDNGCGEATATHPIRVDNDNVYLSGRYVELGMGPNGSFGSTLDAPVGYHANAPEIAYWDPEACYSDTSFRKLGMVYDYGHVGWSVDSPAYFGDYVIYGVPQEGWSVSLDGITSDAFDYNYQYLCSGYTGWFNAPNSHNIGVTTGGGTTIATWQGRIDSANRHFAITQTTRLDTNASWVVLTTKIVNNGVDVNNVFFNRTISPKNDVGEDGSFITANAIGSMPWHAIVSATGTVYSNAYIGLVTEDSRTKAYIIDSGILTIDSLARIWNGSSPYLLSGADTAAGGMGIVFNLGTINAGDSVTFTYAYIFNGPSGADSVFPNPTIYVNSNTYPDTATVTVCGTVTDSSINAGINNGGAYNWTWSPTTGLSADTGVNNQVALGDIHGTVVYTVAGTSKSIGDTVKRNLYLIINSTPPPNSIAGSSVLCSGVPSSFTDSVSGGAWMTSNPFIATIGSVSGVAMGIAAGVDTISYSVSNGCGATATSLTITVNPTPDAGSISGTAIVTEGFSTTLSDVATGGVWSSSSTSIATVNASGTVTGLTPGTATISYTATNSCGTVAATIVVTVNSISAGTITGTATLCADATTTLADATTGGVWSSTNITVATVGSTGVVSGLSSGTTTISYTVTSGSVTVAATQVVTVNPLPAAGTITGTVNVCASASTTLSDTASGGVWSSTNMGVATVGSTGIVSGVTAGTTTISYTVTNSCGTGAATAGVTVNATPIAGSIGGTASVTEGSSTTLTDGASGGVWSSGSGTIASVNASGVVTGLTPGTATISYTVTNSCGTVAATVVVTVNASSAGVITGTATVCASSTTTLADLTTGGVWSRTNTTVATVGSTGVVNGLTLGTTTISYAVTNGSVTVAAILVITVNPLPVAGTITGTVNVCASVSTTLSDAASGGIWSSANMGVATVGSTGIVGGVTGGTTTISYTVTNGCGTVAATTEVTVNATPIAGSISGTASVTEGSATTLTDETSGGVWSSGSSTIASVNASGVVAGLIPGTATISYTVTNSCGAVAATVMVTVNALSAGVITGTATVCANSTTTLADLTTGGVWSSTNTTVATVGSTGVVHGLTSGTTTISYTVTNGSVTVAATQMATINPLPVAGTITGTVNVCASASTTLSDTASGGVWSSTNMGVATVGSTGVVSGVTAGMTTISYTVTNGCGTVAATTAVTVNAAPIAGSISGTASVTEGSSTTLTDGASGGVWSSGSSTIASVNASGVVTGLTPGTATISYTVTNSCGTVAATVVVTVNALSAGVITGTATVCASSTTTLADLTTGGVWSSTNTTIATVGSTGVVHGLTSGTTTISYTVTNGSVTVAATQVVTVNPLPVAGTITGTVNVCASASTTLSDAASGGVWSSTNMGVATVGSTGIVSGVTAGTTAISYTVTNGCGTGAATAGVTVNATPIAGAISGTASVTEGSSTTLTDVASGGVWSSGSSTIASVNASGVVAGLIPGTATISYTVTNSCGTVVATVVVTVNVSSAGVITGTATVCANSTTTLTDATTGGVWSSTNTTVATVGSAGVVHGLTSGTTTISYTVTNGSVTVAATQVVTVNPLPAAGTITGTVNVCASASTTLSDAASGGAWSSTNMGVATVGSTGIVSGVTAGTTTISYTVTNGCGTVAATVVVTVNATPEAGSITGTTTVAEGSSTTLTDAASDGVWSSGNIAVATVNASGVVTGLTLGTATISYTATNSCRSATATVVVTVNAVSVSAISGTATVCAGATTTLADATAGGMWSSTNTAVATISTAGVVRGITSGTTIISYTVTRGSATVAATRVVTVNPLPVAGTITGTASVCTGSTTSLSDATGGVWRSSNTSVAVVSSSGTVGGVTSGTAIISYTVTSGSCGSAVATKVVTVNATSSAGTITGIATVCSGATTLLSDATGSGTWSSSNSGVATVSGSGSVRGIAAGTAIISYIVTSSCGCGSSVATTVVTVTAAPGAGTITGTATVCSGSSTTLSDEIGGGTWRSSNTDIATVSSTGVVTGEASGTATISYSVTTSCGTVVATKVVTVNGTPGTCTGSFTLGRGAYTGTVVNTIYLGYGSQNATLSCTPYAGSGCTYNWACSEGTSNLSDTHCQNPVFTASASGSHDYTCTATNSNGCSSGCSVSVCVIDAVDHSCSGHVLLCHADGCAPTTLSLTPTEVCSHLPAHCPSDHLGPVGSDCGTLGRESGEDAQSTVVDGLTVTAFPNPFTGEVTVKIQSSMPGNVDVLLYDVTGRVMDVRTGQPANTAVTFGIGVVPGIYLIEVKQGDQSRKVKVVKE